MRTKTKSEIRREKAEEIYQKSIAEKDRDSFWKIYRRSISAVQARERVREKASIREEQFKIDDVSGYVYIICDEHNKTKIGVTVDIKQRLTALQVSCSSKLSVRCLIKSNNPYSLEKILHNKFHRLNTQGEWFDLKDYLKLFTSDSARCDFIDNEISVCDDWLSFILTMTVQENAVKQRKSNNSSIFQQTLFCIGE